MRLALTVLLSISLLTACGGDDPAPEGNGDAGGGSSRAMPDLEPFTKIDVAGFDRTRARTTSMGLTASYARKAKTATGATMHAMVTISSCASGGCGPLSKDMDKKALMADLPPAHQANPDLRFDVMEVPFGSTKGIATYALSYMEKKESGGTSRSKANNFRATTHDGTALVSIHIYTMGGASARSLADLEKGLGKDEALAAAKAIYAAFAAVHE